MADNASKEKHGCSVVKTVKKTVICEKNPNFCVHGEIWAQLGSIWPTLMTLSKESPCDD